MNILVDALPTMIRVGDNTYNINWDFRTSINILEAFADRNLVAIEKQGILLKNLFVEEIRQEDQEDAVKLAAKFIAGPSNKDGDGGDNKLYYSMSKDAPLIYAAFHQTHGIDLQESHMHWWKFLALFADLGSETVFCNLVGLRKRVASGEASKEEQKAARNMGDMFKVEQIDDRTIEEIEAERQFMSLAKANKVKK